MSTTNMVKLQDGVPLITITHEFDSNKYPILNKVEQVFFKHYRDEPFLQALRACNGFNHTEDTGDIIANKIATDTSIVIIGVYKSFFPWSRSIASTNLAKKRIAFNIRKLSSSGTPMFNKLVEQRVCTLMHEYIHTLGYTHVTNFRTDFNLGTAPYKIADIFVKYLKDNNII